MADFLEDSKSVVKPHLTLLIQAAITISQNKDLLFNVRETTIHFLESMSLSFGKVLSKKKFHDTLKQIIDCGFRIASESTEEYPDEEESPHTAALYMLSNYACEVSNKVAYPLFKSNIIECCNHSDPLVRKAGVKIMGHICESDALLDCVKEDIDELTEMLVKGLKDTDMSVREAGMQVVSEFAENVIPDFLDLHDQVMPLMLRLVSQQLEIATTNSEHALSAEKAFFAIAQFAQ